ncbi:unnamed protein product [Arctogadus glacialis]
MQQENSTMFRDLLRSTCQGYTKAVMTQENTPVGAQIVYDGAKGNTSVTSDIFDTLAKPTVRRSAAAVSPLHCSLQRDALLLYPLYTAAYSETLCCCSSYSQLYPLYTAAYSQLYPLYTAAYSQLYPLYTPAYSQLYPLYTPAYSETLCCSCIPFTLQPTVRRSAQLYPLYTAAYSETLSSCSSYSETLCCSYIPFTLQPTVRRSAQLYPLYTAAYSETLCSSYSETLCCCSCIPFTLQPTVRRSAQLYPLYTAAYSETLCCCIPFTLQPTKNPFSSKPWDTCSVVGNGGILSNSTCGEMIDSAQFVIRCNLPPVESSHLKDVGNKTGLVTANPSILNRKFSGLLDRRRPFVESMRHYNDALMLLPAFTLSKNIQPSLRVVYTIEESLSPIRPVFLNPEYIRNLHSFWRSKGLNKRLSSGLMVASLALELCTNVHLYGFWPFDQHPLLHQPLNNHYYDNVPSKKKVHAMPDEFDHLLRLHEQGVLKIHLGECV